MTNTGMYTIQHNYIRVRKVNWPSAYEHPSIINEYLKKEFEIRPVFGATDALQISDVHVSRFSVIPNKDNKWGFIRDLSYASRYNVNEGIKK